MCVCGACTVTRPVCVSVGPVQCVCVCADVWCVLPFDSHQLERGRKTWPHSMRPMLTMLCGCLHSLWINCSRMNSQHTPYYKRSTRRKLLSESPTLRAVPTRVLRGLREAVSQEEGCLERAEDSRQCLSGIRKLFAGSRNIFPYN